MTRKRGRRSGHRTNSLRSSCGEVLIRARTPIQIAENYEGLALEAAGAQDVVTEQSYLQHAEHYRRVGRTL
jgi:hypothetical protein